ncbi:MAG: hypothetical protein HOJ35_00120 [Bdellovibrionales bacterium]|jgi:hypothetical protein|nr:hypothetical protein [Bdellovibrionales bacterium]
MKKIILLYLFIVNTSFAASFNATFYHEDIKPILDKRCTVCHGCYSSPCNMKLDSYFGILRGSSKENIYGFRYKSKLKPNRMFQDALTHNDWQSKHNYSPVISQNDFGQENLDKSILYQIIDFRDSNSNSDLTFKFSPDSSRSCVSNKQELKKYKEEKNPLAGMPYGMTPLSSQEKEIIKSWIELGSPGPSYKELKETENSKGNYTDIITAWNNFLNQKSIKQQLISRYLFEHFYLSHIHFAKNNRDYFRIVRSSTPFPSIIKEIVTNRPYNDPKTKKVYYRFKRIVESIVNKNHNPILLNKNKLQKIINLFSSQEWKAPRKLPTYSVSKAANPFKTFKNIPAKIRYQFFLNNSYYFVRSFIHGPVCNGEIATDVIRDHFWVTFLSPDHDPTALNSSFLEKEASHLAMPASAKRKIKYKKYLRKNKKYQKEHAKLVNRTFKNGLKIDHLWNVDDKNMFLTVFRHFDFASVHYGAKGIIPKTIWVLDYPIFERIYYNLVAGFNVWGGTTHKLATRKYMDLLRTESEDIFLLFFPKQIRKKLRFEWDSGLGVFKKIIRPYRYSNYVKLENSNFKSVRDVFLSMKEKFSSKILNAEKSNSLQSLESIRGTAASFFPEVTLIKVGNKSYSIFANRDRNYVNYLFVKNYNHSKDYLTVINSLDISYANLFIEVDPNKVKEFVQDITKIQNKKQWKTALRKYAVSRTGSNFWEISDWFQDQAIKMHPETGGIIDLSQYMWSN